MNQNFQAIVQDASKEKSTRQESVIFSGVLLAFNVSVMLFVGLYWMNPEMHEFISGRPLL